MVLLSNWRFSSTPWLFHRPVPVHSEVVDCRHGQQACRLRNSNRHKSVKKSGCKYDRPYCHGDWQAPAKIPVLDVPTHTTSVSLRKPHVQQPWRLISNIISITQCLYRDMLPRPIIYTRTSIRLPSSQINTAIILAMIDHASQSKPNPKGETSQKIAQSSPVS